MTKEITWADIERAAASIKAEPCAVQAVYTIETNGNLSLTDGRPKILFEGHIFWKELKKAGIDPAGLAAANPDIIYQKWTKQFYKGGAAEYDRLARAKAINEDAALKSASWGAFQLMGFNYAACGFSSVGAFVKAMEASAGAQLDAFIKFIQSSRLDEALRAKNGAAFAKGYNGPGYATNQYDVKLGRAYMQCLTSKK